MIAELPPVLIFFLGGLLTPFLKGRVKQGVMLLIPVWAFAVIWAMPEGSYWTVQFLGHDLVFGLVDRMSKVFGYGFAIVFFIGALYALRVEEDFQHVSAFVYAGSALGVTFAGDFFTVYIFWEIMAVASTFLILASRDAEARGAAFRYVLMHLFGGLLLLAGILLRYQETGSLELGVIGLSGLSSWLIFLGIGLNAAFPVMHPWLTDAYPRATVTGAVFLCAFTTKSAVYLMARTYPGTELLIYLGAYMCVFPIFYAVLANDIRVILSYSLINQIGFMMVGIGIGTELALNGAVSHAFCHLIYKCLLFMGAGSVLHMTGRIRCTDLGWLYKYMPLTTVCTMVGAASISAFPLFSGFVSKSMIVSSAGHHHMVLIWFMLQFASAGVIHHHGLKIPYFMFFSQDLGIRAEDPPWNMRLAMILASVLCVGIAVFPGPLYSILPYPVDYVPYTPAHVMGTLQLLCFGALAFCLLILSGVYPPELRAVNLDTDWFYRMGARAFTGLADRTLNGLNTASERILVDGAAAGLAGWTREAPARIAVAPLSAYWRITGVRKEERRRRRADALQNVKEGLLPAGLGAVMSGGVLIYIFLLA